ncbi:MAG TPA: phenylalanine--tRNA ligase subunit alpha [Chlamydiales bacterium]|nr:phenylalanine--tRNA ligase subunit alpha [Chlamydiales bacterium]
MTLQGLISDLRTSFIQELNNTLSVKDLDALKTKYLGKKGSVQSLMTELKSCSSDERPHMGKLINDLKEELTSHVENSLIRLQNEEIESRLSKEIIDPTLPGVRQNLGKLHPIQQMMDKIVDILMGMGFSVQSGPDVDTEYYNFEGLNFAPDHPARDMQDTFYLENDLLLRTHTSNVQVHTMEKYKPPIRVIAPGRCFRNEDISARSHVFFHQIEGFYIDRDVTFADLMSTMEEFLSKLLGEKVITRFRPSYFPFVEPGMEVDVRCTSCRGSGCRICKHTGWLEILGAGMIHPNVLKKGNIDPEEFSGFAWGMGIERLVILQGGIPDIRLFTQNDVRFLSQFA